MPRSKRSSATLPRRGSSPSIAEIREGVAAISSTAPSVETALQELDRAVRRYNPDDSRTWTYEQDWSHPLIARAVAIAGGVASCGAPKYPVLSGGIPNAYVSLCEDEVRQVQLAIASAPKAVKELEAAS